MSAQAEEFEDDVAAIDRINLEVETEQAAEVDEYHRRIQKQEREQREEKARLMKLDLPALRALFEEHAKDALAECLKNPESIKQSVTNLVTQITRKIVLQSLGFRDDGFGRVEVDRNRSNGTLPMFEEASRAARLLIAEKFQSEVTAHYADPKVCKAHLASFMKAVEDSMNLALREAAREAGAAEAATLIELIVPPKERR